MQYMYMCVSGAVNQLQVDQHTCTCNNQHDCSDGLMVMAVSTSSSLELKQQSVIGHLLSKKLT